MTAPRSYAPVRSVPEALAELRRCAGTQSDPAVVDAFATAAGTVVSRSRSTAG